MARKLAFDPPEGRVNFAKQWMGRRQRPINLSADVTYFKAMDETWELLAAYIRNNKDAFASLKTESP